RREATVLFQHLFTYRSRRSEMKKSQARDQQSESTKQSAKTGSRQISGITKRGGLRVLDDDEFVFSSMVTDQSDSSMAFDWTNDFPELFPVMSASRQSSAQSD